MGAEAQVQSNATSMWLYRDLQKPVRQSYPRTNQPRSLPAGLVPSYEHSIPSKEERKEEIWVPGIHAPAGRLLHV